MRKKLDMSYQDPDEYDTINSIFVCVWIIQ